MKFRRKWERPSLRKSRYRPPDKYFVEITKQPKSIWSAALGVISVVSSTVVAIVTLNSYMKNTQEEQESQIYSQARLISAWDFGISPDLDNVDGNEISDINNLSNSPVYHVVITSVYIGNGNTTPAVSGLKMRQIDSDEENGAYISILPPGKYALHFVPAEMSMGKRLGIEISFRDSNGRSWILNADGKLSQIKKDPFSYYPVPSPMTYADLESQ